MAEDITMDNPSDFLVTRRSRRSTAGNRMEAALAEMALDDGNREVEDDVDFVNDRDEEDIFESDFESTDEEAAAMEAEGEGGDKTVQDEEKRARKAARSRVEKATAAAHAKHKVTFNPQAQASTSEKKSKTKLKLTRRVSMGTAIDAETGELMDIDMEARGEGESPSAAGKKRKSQRKHTILNTSATVRRMMKSEEKKAAATPKKFKVGARALTQGELIARALDNEEGNIVEHRDYLKLEEEKRKRARVVRTAIDGPLLRWVSRVEDETIKVDEPPVQAPQPKKAGGYPYSYAYGTGTFAGSSVTSYGQAAYAYSTAIGTGGQSYTGGVTMPPFTSSSTTFQPQSQMQMQPQNLPVAPSYNMYQLPTPTSNASPAAMSGVTPNTAPPLTAVVPKRTEKVAKNYVIHEAGQYEGLSKPQWGETMTAMFGNHVKWEDVKVYIGKGRPLSRPKQLCPITGRIARYLDPRTGVPYADLRAYEVLTSILKHDYVWSPELGCYVGRMSDIGGSTAKPVINQDSNGKGDQDVVSSSVADIS